MIDKSWKFRLVFVCFSTWAGFLCSGVTYRSMCMRVLFTQQHIPSPERESYVQLGKKRRLGDLGATVTLDSQWKKKITRQTHPY